MTYEQESMWLEDHLYDGPSHYLESWAYRLSGPLDTDAAEWAIRRVVDRHEALRSRLTLDGDQLVQIVLPESDIRLVVRSCPAPALASELRRTVSQPMDLDSSALRATLLRVAPDESVLVIQFHHAVVDDWALAILDGEFSELYTARVQGRPPQLTPLPTQLGEYALAQRSAGIDEAVLAYWQDQLHEPPTLNAPPPDRPRSAVASYQGKQYRFRISDDAGQRIRDLGRSLRTTPFSVFAAALTALLCGYNGTCDLVLGTPVSRRGDPSLDALIACLTDLMPLRQAVHLGESFTHLVASTRAVVWDAITHKDVPYTSLVSCVTRRRDIGASRLCQTVLVVDDTPHEPLRLPGLTAERIYVHSGVPKFHLLLTLVIDHRGYQGFLDYASDLYDPETAERIARDFQAVLGMAVRDPGQPLSAILRAITGTTLRHG